MNTIILDPALREFADAVTYYNEESPGLGYEFADEVFRTIERLTEMPNAWPVLSKRTRRCITRHFPYGIVYQQRKDTLIVVSVMHLRRHPDSWKNNVRNV